MLRVTHWKALHSAHFSGKAVLVTGGAGFIGSHLAEALVSLGAQVRVLDDLSAGKEPNLPPGARFARGSILDRAALARVTAGCDLVFHQAALGSVPRSVEQPELYAEVNIQGTLNVLLAARDAGVKRVMYAASSSAYGDTPTLPKHEAMPVSPRSPYAATKVAGEALLIAFAASYGLQTVSLRYFNIFGRRQTAGSAYAAVIPAFAERLRAGQRPVIYGDGSFGRDFTHVDNAVHANLLAARSPHQLTGEVFNVGCGRMVTIEVLALEMARQLGKAGITPEHLPGRAGDVAFSLADLSRISQGIGYHPLVGFEQGLADLLA